MAGCRLLAGILSLAVVALVAGCASKSNPKPEPVIEKDVARVIKLSDGSTCIEPAGLTETRQSPGAVQVSELFGSGAKPEETLAKVKELKATDAEAGAAYFDVCRAYSKDEIKKDVFEKNRKIYLELRQQLLAQGIKAWTDRKEGIKEPGKLCHVVFGTDEAGTKNFARWVPETTTVDDCALFASRAGASEVLLGCTEGQWKNHWAKRSIAAGPLGASRRGLEVRDTAAAPDPNCGWL